MIPEDYEIVSFLPPSARRTVPVDKASTTRSRTPPPGASRSTFGAYPLYIPLKPSSRTILINAGYDLHRRSDQRCYTGGKGLTIHPSRGAVLVI